MLFQETIMMPIKNRMMTAVLAAVAAGFFAAAAGAGDEAGPSDIRYPVVLRAEQDVYGFYAQQAVAFEQDKVVFSRNSNFLCEPSRKVLLGVMSLAYSPGLRANARLLDQIALRLHGAPDEDGPHQLSYYLGKNRLFENDPYLATVKRQVLELCDAEGIETEKAASVELGKDKAGRLVLTVEKLRQGKITETVSTPAGEDDCSDAGGGVWKCRVPGYGLAFLRYP
jgi:hypothetical protein